MPPMIRTYGGITSSDAVIVPDNAGIGWSDPVIAAKPHEYRAGAMTHKVVERRAGRVYR